MRYDVLRYFANFATLSNVSGNVVTNIVTVADKSVGQTSGCGVKLVRQIAQIDYNGS